jgi:hypothetical protein
MTIAIVWPSRLIGRPSFLVHRWAVVDRLEVRSPPIVSSPSIRVIVTRGRRVRQSQAFGGGVDDGDVSESAIREDARVSRPFARMPASVGQSRGCPRRCPDSPPHRGCIRRAPRGRRGSPQLGSRECGQAQLGLCLAALISKFRFLKPALILILAFVGVKLLLLSVPPYLDVIGMEPQKSIKIDTTLSLVIVLATLALATVVSVLIPANAKESAK